MGGWFMEYENYTRNDFVETILYIHGSVQIRVSFVK